MQLRPIAACNAGQVSTTLCVPASQIQKRRHRREQKQRERQRGVSGERRIQGHVLPLQEAGPQGKRLPRQKGRRKQQSASKRNQSIQRATVQRQVQQRLPTFQGQLFMLMVLDLGRFVFLIVTQLLKELLKELWL